MLVKLIHLISFVSCFSLLGVVSNTSWASESLANDLSFNLKPLSSETYKLAKATFLPDYDESPFSGNKTLYDYNYDNGYGNCNNKDNLYTNQNCTYPRAVVASSQCPFLPGYYTECECLPQFNKTSCTSPYILGGTSCDGKYEKCVCPATVSLTNSNDTCTQYCDGNCIAKSCTPLASQTGCTNGTTYCDNGCGVYSRKCCVACTNKVTSKPANSSYTYASCYDGTSKQIQTGWKCNTGYHQSGDTCVQDCTENTCSGYTLTACPANATCSSCTKQTSSCSGGETLFKFTGCASGYHANGTTCVAHSYSCPSGYQTSACSSSQVQTATTSQKCSCGATSGICYACSDKTSACEEALTSSEMLVTDAQDLCQDISNKTVYLPGDISVNCSTIPTYTNVSFRSADYKTACASEMLGSASLALANANLSGNMNFHIPTRITVLKVVGSSGTILFSQDSTVTTADTEISGGATMFVISGGSDNIPTLRIGLSCSSGSSCNYSLYPAYGNIIYQSYGNASITCNTPGVAAVSSCKRG